jgi:hypothetical protein
VLVLTAAFVALVFWRGMGATAEAVVATGPGDEVATVPSTFLPPTTAVPPPRSLNTRVAPRELQVLVGNGIDAKLPVATTVAAKLRMAGYSTIRSVNLAQPADRSTVLYLGDDLRDEATALARALALPDTDVAPLGPGAGIDPGAAKVVVVVGREPRALSESGAPATPGSTTPAAPTAAGAVPGTAAGRGLVVSGGGPASPSAARGALPVGTTSVPAPRR